VIELRYFGGLNEAPIAEVLKTFERTVRHDWDFAKSWLTRELSHEPNGSDLLNPGADKQRCFASFY